MNRSFNRISRYCLIVAMMMVCTCVLILQACKKVIQVNLNTTTPQIVIEGEVTNFPGPYMVRISKTVNFSASNVYPPVSGASVTITDSTTGLTDILKETDSGTYVTSQLKGKPKHSYYLSVNAEGQQYTANSTMPQEVHLDSVTFSENVGFDNKSQINAIVNFQDPPVLGNYYQFVETLNGRLVPNIFVFENRLSVGKYISQPLFNDSSYLQHGDTLGLNMYCIDKNIYNYFFTLIQVTGNNNFQTATPANPNTNISNGALGYFSAHTVTERQSVIF
jgi:uncharacterized protein DUF4249